MLCKKYLCININIYIIILTYNKYTDMNIIYL